MTEAIRLVVWDLDETFWRGTLSEGGADWREDTAQIVRELARRGVMSTICSKNDPGPVRAILDAHGLWESFIFPSLDWTAKGPRIARLIETVGLRAPSVMLIDDNPHNLAEAARFAPGLQTEAETVIPGLLADPRLRGKDDHALKRLKQYKVLEARKADEARLEGDGEDALAFLRASDVRVRIETDVEAHLDRAIELINRTNQLNFLKRRLPEDIEAARRRLREEIADFTTQVGLVEVSDRYGDYGFCGYFQVTTRRGVVQLRQFCFSCRILGLGVEAFIHQRLGRPELRVRGEVLSDPAAAGPVDWIRMISGPGGPGARAAAQGASAEQTADLSSVAIRGGCVLWPLLHYFSLSSKEVVGEFNTARDGKLIGLDHSLCLRHALLGVSEEALAAVAPLGYRAEDFRTRYFEHSGARPVWVFSSWADGGRCVFRHNRTGMTIPYVPARKERQKAAHEGLAEYLAAEFTPFEYGEAELKETLELVFSRLPAHGLMFVLRATEKRRRRADGAFEPHPQRIRFNAWCAEAAAPYPQVRLVSMDDFVDDEREVLNDHLTHFDRKVYHRLYDRIRSDAEASLAGES